MKQLALVAVILIAGCASTHTSTSDWIRSSRNWKQRGSPSTESEKQCVDDAMKRSDDGIASIAVTPDASLKSQTQKIKNNTRDREISQCHALADHENAQIAEQERNEYEHEAEQERNHILFLAIVTAPTPLRSQQPSLSDLLE